MGLGLGSGDREGVSALCVQAKGGIDWADGRVGQ